MSKQARNDIPIVPMVWASDWIDTHLAMLKRLDDLRPGTRIYCREWIIPEDVPKWRSPWLPSGDSWKRGIWA